MDAAGVRSAISADMASNNLSDLQSLALQLLSEREGQVVSLATRNAQIETLQTEQNRLNDTRQQLTSLQNFLQSESTGGLGVIPIATMLQFIRDMLAL